MIIIIKQVVKIGGSLFPKHAIKLAKELKNTNSCIILGGGEFANLIRKYDDVFNFSDETNQKNRIIFAVDSNKFTDKKEIAMNIIKATNLGNYKNNKGKEGVDNE